MTRLFYFSPSLFHIYGLRFARVGLLLFLLNSSICHAEKTDIVELLNGDHITGEVTQVQRGKLEFKTDDAGTLNIEWTKVAQLKSTQYLEFEVSSGRRYFGTLAESGKEGVLAVVNSDTGATTEISIIDTVRVAVLDESGRLRDQVSGSVDFGYADIKSTDSTRLSFGFELTHRDRVRLWGISGSAQESDTSTASSNSASIIGEHRRFFVGNRRFYTGALMLETNDELGLDLRWLIGGGFGSYLVQTDAQELGLLAGIAWSNEEFADGQTNESAELMLGISYDVFRFDTPKIDVSSRLVVFPSLTVSDRVRANAEISVRYEIISDLFAELRLTDSYDNKPQSAGAEKNDYSVITSLGYTF